MVQTLEPKCSEGWSQADLEGASKDMQKVWLAGTKKRTSLASLLSSFVLPRIHNEVDDVYLVSKQMVCKQVIPKESFGF